VTTFRDAPAVVSSDLDTRFRATAFAYLDGVTNESGGLVTRQQLEAFTFEGDRVPLIERQRGIRKVSWLEAAISMLTTFVSDPAQAPYDDKIGEDGYPRYKWQGTDGTTFDNRSLRVAMERQLPLVYLVGVERGLYEAHYPVWLVAEEPAERQFVLALEETMREQWSLDLFHPADVALRREYALSIVKRRLHQRLFRDRVLIAYRRQCSLCGLRHAELLDAAHIKEDSQGGEPIVPNGVAMCAIHHRAFDHHLLGIRPDYVVEIRADVLEEKDGPTLRHTLQGVHGAPLRLPTQAAARPDPLLLEERWAVFRAAG
jgi:putative restriction endonuclease